MENNATDEDPCAWYQHAASTAQLICYDIIMPLHVILGLSGHALSLISFYKQAKEHSGYMYQIFIAWSESVEIITYAIYVATFYWFSGSDGRSGVDWFMSSYVCMWFTAHISMPLVNSFVTLSLLLGVAMAADRIFALGKPISYKNINHKRHQYAALVVSLIIGISTSLFDAFRFTLIEEPNGFYTLGVNADFMGLFLATFLSQLRNAIRGFGVVALVCGNAIMMCLYRRFTTKAGAMVTSSGDLKRREQQKMLTLLAIFESLFAALEMTVFIEYYLVLYIQPDFYACKGSFQTPISDGLIELFDICDFYMVFAISKNFRQMIFDSVPCLKRFSSTSAVVVPISTTSVQQRNSIFVASSNSQIPRASIVPDDNHI